MNYIATRQEGDTCIVFGIHTMESGYQEINTASLQSIGEYGDEYSWFGDINYIDNVKEILLREYKDIYEESGDVFWKDTIKIRGYFSDIRKATGVVSPWQIESMLKALGEI